MGRIKPLVSLLVAVVMTAFTFGAIGQSADAQASSHGMSTATHMVSEGLVTTRVAFRAVLTRLVRKS
jgi:hypothetical protein